MAQINDTDPSLAWSDSEDGGAWPYAGSANLPPPSFPGSGQVIGTGPAVHAEREGGFSITRESMANSSGAISFRVQAKGWTQVVVGLAGTNWTEIPPTGSPAAPLIFCNYGRTDSFEPGYAIRVIDIVGGNSAFINAYPVPAFGLWDFGSQDPWYHFEKVSTGASTLDGEEREFTVACFYKKDANQMACIFSMGDVRVTSGWVDLAESAADWGAHVIRVPSAFDGGYIDDIRVQYDWTDAQADASYEAALGGGTVGAGGVITGGPTGIEGLPGEIGGFPGPVSRSTLLPSSTGKASHARILASYRSAAEARAFHDSMRNG